MPLANRQTIPTTQNNQPMSGTSVHMFPPQNKFNPPTKTTWRRYLMEQQMDR